MGDWRLQLCVLMFLQRCVPSNQEQDANTWQCKKEVEFLCRDLSACISGDDLCDGHVDCDDGSDEVDNCEQRCTDLNCGIHSRCDLLTSGGVQCVCREGFQQAPGQGCVDVNECDTPPGRHPVCSQHCFNVLGSYRCFCDSGYHLASNRRTCLLNDGEDPWLVYVTRHELVSYNLRYGKDFTFRQDVGIVHGLAVDYDSQRVFWTESQPSVQPAVFVAALGDIAGTKEPVAKFGLKQPHGMTFDPRQKNLYITDTAIPAIIACRTEAPYYITSSQTASGELSAPVSDFVCVTVYNETILSSPTELVLDHEHGYLYWVDLAPSPRIMRGRADGMNVRHFLGGPRRQGFKPQRPTTLVSSRLKLPSSLALDLPTNTLFWTDSGLNVIECVGFDGRQRRTIHSSNIREPTALLVLENRVMWANSGGDRDIMEIDLGSDREAEIQHLLDDDVTAMVLAHPILEKHNDLGSCSAKTCYGVCLLGPQRAAVCACAEGQDQKERCKETDQPEVLYAAYKEEIRGLRVEHFSRLSPHTFTTSDMRNVDALTYLPLSGDLIFASFYTTEKHTESTIYRLSNFSTETGSPTSSVLIEDAGTVDCLVADEASQLIYWVDRYKEAIELASLDGQHRSRLPSNEIQQPLAIAVDGTHRTLYVSDMKGQPSIKRCQQDGVHCTSLLSSHLVRPSALTIRGDDLYWTDSWTGGVSSLHIYTGRVTQHAINRRLPHSLAVSQNSVFWTEQYPWQDGIYYVSLSGYRDASVSPEQPIRIRTGRSGVASLVLASPSFGVLAGSDSVPNKCREENGGCDHLCIPGLSKVTCLCSDGFLLQADETSCRKAGVPSCPDFSCSDGSGCVPHDQVCDASLDCRDGSDEIDCPDQREKLVCEDGEWECGDGLQCISEDYVCDHHNDCNDLSDEGDCAGNNTSDCSSKEFHCYKSNDCTHLAWRCDGDEDCDHGEDEENCSPETCSPLHFTCPDGSCVTRRHHCLELNVTSTTARSDLEEVTSCEGKFQCGSDECVEESQVCDSIPHCLDGSDESNCKLTCKNFKACSHMCEETNHGPRCVCYSGYQLNERNICEDIDECLTRNGGCSQVCENRRGSFLCKCLDGFAIDRDKRRCKAVSRPTLYTGTMEGYSQFELYGDLPLRNLTLPTVLKTVSLDVNAHTGDVYWLAHKKPLDKTASATSSVVYRTVLWSAESGSPSTVPVLTVDGLARDIALDWVTGNLYITTVKTLMTKPEPGQGGLSDLHLQVLCHGNDHLRSLVRESYLHRGTTSQGLVLHPGRRLVFYIAGSKLLSRWMDGSHRTVVISDLGHSPSGLSMDVLTNRLYWVTYTDQSQGALQVCNLDGSHRYRISRTEPPVPYMDVFEGLAYTINPYTHCLSTLELYDKPATQRDETTTRDRVWLRTRVGVACDGLVSLHGVFYSGPVRVVHQLKQPPAENPCSNMSCMFMCVPTPDGGRCLCDDDHRFMKGNPGCQGPKVTPTLSQPIETNFPLTSHPAELTDTPLPSISAQAEITSLPSEKGTSLNPNTIKLTDSLRVTKTQSATTVSISSPTTTSLKSSAAAAALVTSSTTTTTEVNATSLVARPVDSCDLCGPEEVCSNSTGQLVCLCKHGEACPNTTETKSRAPQYKGNKSLTWIVAVVVPVVGTMVFIVVGVGCYCSRRKRGHVNLLTTITFKNPNCSAPHGDKDDLVPRVSFAGTFFKDELVDDEADCTVDEDWWRRLLTRSRISLDSTNMLKPLHHIRTISTVEEVDEMDGEEEEEGYDRVREVGRRATDSAPCFRPGGGTGKDPQCLDTSDKSRLLL